MMNVFDLAQTDTTLKKVSSKEYAGPCPRCHSTDSFHVQPHSGENGSWMCRKCWDPSEIITVKGEQRKRGWGDNIEYLRQFRSMSFTAAKNYLAGQVESTLERVHSLQQSSSHNPGDIPGPYWQRKYKPFVAAAADRLWTPEGRAGLDYLLSRGLTDETIRNARLGYANRYRRPCVVIPWFDEREEGYWRVSLRDITPGIAREERYKPTLPGFSNEGMYLGDSLTKRKLTTFLVEGELDALSIVQEAGDIVNVVATGSTGNARVPKWEGRLARMPSVLVAFDREDKGEKAAHYWLNLLHGVTPVLRYRPLAHDANEMLLQGYNVRTWVQSALDYLSEQDQDTSSLPSQVIPALVLPALTCSICGVDLATIDTGAYDENEIAFCNYHQDTLQPYCSRAGTYEQFMSTVNRIAGVFGPDCKITPESKDYTPKQHVAMLKQQEQQAERDMWAKARKKKARAHTMEWTRAQVRRRDPDAEEQAAKDR